MEALSHRTYQTQAVTRGPVRDTGGRVEPADPYREHAVLITDVLRKVADRHRLDQDLRERFTSFANERLLANDCAKIRSFQGRSSLRTYLTTVINRLFLDFRNHIWGKWRPSTVATDLGDIAVKLERYVVRDAMTLRESVHRIVTESEGLVSEREVYALHAQLPSRLPKMILGLDDAPPLESNMRADDALWATESQLARTRLRDAVTTAVAQLAPKDQLILRMHFTDGFTLAAISRQLDLPQKPLYGRVSGVLATLRRSLEEQGYSKSSVIPLPPENTTRFDEDDKPADASV